MKLACCGQLIGHKCIYEWLRPSQIHSGKGNTRCPFGCLLSLDGEDVSEGSQPVDGKKNTKQGMRVASHEETLSSDKVYDESLYNHMNASERAFWMSKSYRLRRSILRLVRFGK